MMSAGGSAPSARSYFQSNFIYSLPNGISLRPAFHLTWCRSANMTTETRTAAPPVPLSVSFEPPAVCNTGPEPVSIVP